jgi:16S rRNA (cytosine967-C5)-methyltransferase
VLEEQRIALEMGDYLKMLPHKHGTDGFFAAVFERKAAPAKAARDESAKDESATGTSDE